MFKMIYLEIFWKLIFPILYRTVSYVKWLHAELQHCCKQILQDSLTSYLLMFCRKTSSWIFPLLITWLTCTDLAAKQCVPCDSKDMRAMNEELANQLIAKVCSLFFGAVYLFLYLYNRSEVLSVERKYRYILRLYVDNQGNQSANFLLFSNWHRPKANNLSWLHVCPSRFLNGIWSMKKVNWSWAGHGKWNRLLKGWSFFRWLLTSLKQKV